eukprot:jgi/Tetstr1/448426/TSEL_035696.t1
MMLGAVVVVVMLVLVAMMMLMMLLMLMVVEVVVVMVVVVMLILMMLMVGEDGIKGVLVATPASSATPHIMTHSGRYMGSANLRRQGAASG